VVDALHVDEEDLAAYSLGALPDDEVQRVDEHLAGCAACRLHADEFRAVVDLLPYSVAQVQPPPGLEERVLAVAAAPRRRRVWRVPAWGTAAAAVLLLAAFGIGGWAVGRNTHQPGPTTVTEARAVSLVGTALAPGATARLAVLHTDSGVQRYVLEAQGLPALKGDAVYVMWLTRDGRRWNCGSFKVDAAGSGMLAYDDWNADYFDQVGVTLEPTPNQTDQPRGPKVLGLQT